MPHGAAVAVPILFSHVEAGLSSSRRAWSGALSRPPTVRPAGGAAGSCQDAHDDQFCIFKSDRQGPNYQGAHHGRVSGRDL